MEQIIHQKEFRNRPSFQYHLRSLKFHPRSPAFQFPHCTFHTYSPCKQSIPSNTERYSQPRDRSCTDGRFQRLEIFDNYCTWTRLLEIWTGRFFLSGLSKKLGGESSILVEDSHVIYRLKIVENSKIFFIILLFILCQSHVILSFCLLGKETAQIRNLSLLTYGPMINWTINNPQIVSW